MKGMQLFSCNQQILHVLAHIRLISCGPYCITAGRRRPCGGPAGRLSSLLAPSQALLTDADHPLAPPSFSSSLTPFTPMLWFPTFVLSKWAVLDWQRSSYTLNSTAPVRQNLCFPESPHFPHSKLQSPGLPGTQRKHPCFYPSMTFHWQLAPLAAYRVLYVP